MASTPRKPRANASAKASTTPAKSDRSSKQDLQDEGSVRAIEAITGEVVAADSGNEPAAAALVAVEAEVVKGNNADRGSEQRLTDAERRRLADLEQEVRESFYRAGCALREIRDSRLYRETHKTFEDYCLDALGYKRAYSYELLDAASTFDNIQKCLRRADILPTSTYQIRPLKKLKGDPQKQADAWIRAVEKADGRQPTYEAVREVVAEFIPAEAPRPGHQQKNRTKQEEWKHAPTETICVPAQFAHDLLKIAHFLDNGGSLSEIGDLGNL